MYDQTTTQGRLSRIPLLLNRKYYHELIDKVAIDKVLHTASIRRIIYAWRTWIKRKHILRTATVRKIVKFLRQNTGEPSGPGQV